MAAFPQDLRYAFRTLRKSPLFSAVAMLSLALGIGANTAIFTLIHQLILQPLPVKDPAPTGHAGRPRPPLRRQQRPRQALVSHVPGYPRQEPGLQRACFARIPSTMSASFAGRTELITGRIRLRATIFRVLGIGAAMGRVFTGYRRSLPGRPSAGGSQLRLLEEPLRRRPRHPGQENRGQRLSAHGDRRQPGGFRRRGARIRAADSRPDHDEQQLAAGRHLRPPQRPPLSLDRGLRPAQARL